MNHRITDLTIRLFLLLFPFLTASAPLPHLYFLPPLFYYCSFHFIVFHFTTTPPLDQSHIHPSTTTTTTTTFTTTFYPSPMFGVSFVGNESYHHLSTTTTNNKQQNDNYNFNDHPSHQHLYSALTKFTAGVYCTSSELQQCSNMPEVKTL